MPSERHSHRPARSTPWVALLGAAALAALLAAPGPALSQTHGSGGAELGRLEFPTSAPDQAQRSFLEGVLWLHSFEYGHAREAFRQAREVDPDFVMAYWGEAMTHNHPVWHEQDLEAGREALARLAPTREERLAKAPTERERDWLGAVEVLFGEGEKAARDRAYAEAMRQLAEKYPEDREAAAFYALALLGTAGEGRDIPTYMRAAAVAEEVFAENPRHPGAVHYLIHSYDDPVHAPLGLRAARVYAELAPDAVHARHMPSHIFLALGDWDAVIESNVASADAAEAQGGVSYHALHWLGYGQLQKARYGEAGETLQRMRAHARLRPTAGARYYLARARATYLVELETGPDAWYDEAAGLEIDHEEIGLLAAASDLFGTGLAALRDRDVLAAAEAVSRIGQAREEALRRGAEGEAPTPGSVEAARAMEAQLAGLVGLAQGELEDGLERLREAVAIESEMRMEYGPPMVPKPARELLGDALLALDRPAEAREAYQAALERAPRRAQSLLGLARAAADAGDRRQAARAYSELAAMWSEADPELAAVAEVRRRARELAGGAEADSAARLDSAVGSTR